MKSILMFLFHYRTGLPPTLSLTNWMGPMKVIKGFNSRYTLLDFITGKETDSHVSDMKSFAFDSAVVDPFDVARRNYMEYFNELQTIMSTNVIIPLQNNSGSFLTCILGGQ